MTSSAGPDLQVHSERFEDRGIGPAGSDYLGWVHEVRVLGTTFWLRGYDDEPHELHVLAWDRANPGRRGSFPKGIPYADAAFAAAARWALSRPGIRELHVLASDPDFPDRAYAPVDPTRLG